MVYFLKLRVELLLRYLLWYLLKFSCFQAFTMGIVKSWREQHKLTYKMWYILRYAIYLHRLSPRSLFAWCLRVKNLLVVSSCCVWSVIFDLGKMPPEKNVNHSTSRVSTSTTGNLNNDSNAFNAGKLFILNSNLF